MRSHHVYVAVGVAALFSFSSYPVGAQGTGTASTHEASLEEIVVTGRKREENLIDVPVSISVWSAESLAEQDIISQQDLFDATVGLDYTDFTGSRGGNNPGVRGVQSDLRASNQQKVASFIDGMPMLGNTGSLQFAGIDAVEIYRGPQSAAFGRSTFAGAINYVTADATDEFTGRVQLRVTDLGGTQIGASLSGPMGDSLGYRVAYLNNKTSGPDEWTSTDGYDMGSHETDQFQAKLNFGFSESSYGEVMYTRFETDDVPGAGFVLDPATCTGDSGIYRTNMGSTLEIPSGAWDCDPTVPEGGVPRNHDVLGHFLAQYDDNIGFYTAAAMSADANMDGLVQSGEYLAQTLTNGQTFEQALLGQTVSDPSGRTIRDRIQGELNFEVGDGLLQFMGMYVDETSDSWAETNNDTLAVFTVNMMTNMTSLSTNIMSMNMTGTIEERYAEVRWISPAQERLRYTLSGSWYDYELQGQVFNNYGAIYHGLTLPDGSPVNPGTGITISELATNLGASFGVQYDLSDRTTLSVEGRYQVDEVCGQDRGGANVETCTDTSAFLPRIALSSSFSENRSVYGQFSVGNNPGGVNIAYADPGNIQALQVANGQIASPADGIVYDGSDGVHFPTVDYDATTFPDFEEERLYNFEIGSKGVYANGRGSYTAALYYMIYENMVGAENLNWNDTNINGWNESNWTNFTAERTWLNNGDGEFYGLELATSFSINDTWTVGGYITLAEAKYTDFCSIQAPNYRDAPGGPAGGGNTLIPILRPENGDDVLSACGVVDGNTLPRHANISGNLNLRANLRNPVFGMRTSLRADVRYKGPYYEDHLSLFERKAVATVNLSATMRKENWNFRFFINNVTDVNEPQRISVAQYYTNRPIPIFAPSQQGSYAVNPRRPREIGLQATYNF